ncbi:MAG: ArnT family glycosyltransferase [Candidatus Hermodarchaeota archaeon]
MKREAFANFQDSLKAWFETSSAGIFISRVKFPLLIMFVGIFLRLFNPHSINMWDEGWFTDITARMLSEGNFLLPLYKEFGTIKLFDKPPFIFWCGALVMAVFGFSSLGAKFVMGFMGGLLGVCAYYLLSKSDENHLVAVIAGLFTSCTWFLVFYSRTAYIDVTIVFLSSLVILLAVRGADEIFSDEPNMRLAYVYLLLCVLANVFSLLAKAWQGLIPGVAAAVYFFVKYLTKKISTKNLRLFWNQLDFSFIPVSAALKNTKTALRFSLLFKYFFGGICAFLLALVFSSTLEIAGTPLIIGLFCVIFTLVALKVMFSWLSISDRKTYYLLTGITSLIGGLASALVSVFTFQVLLGTYGDVVVQFLEVANLQEFALLVNDGLFGLVACLIGTGACVTVCILILGLSLRHEPLLILMRDCLKLLPLLLIGGWVGFWGYFIFFKGEFFDRDPVLTVLVGALGILAILVVAVVLDWLLEKGVPNLADSSLLEMVKDAISSSPYTIYIGMAAFGIIVSFFPLLNWIVHLDTNYVIPGVYELRQPGELQPRPPDFSYTWLFFEYYLGWRYENPSPNPGYDMWSAVSSAFFDPLFIAVAPFFVVGIYAFYKTRHYAHGILFLSWFGIVMTAFLPAAFQLNYYYLAAFLPYLCVAAKGFAYVFKNAGHFITRDALERFLVAIPYSLVVIFLFILEPLANLGYIPPNNLIYFLFLEGGYLVLVWAVSESIPGILSLGVSLYAFYRCFFLFGITDHDWIYLAIAGLAVIICLYWLKDKIRFSGLFLLAMILLSTITCLSWLVYSNDTYGADYESIAQWINSQGGDYDFSTRVFPDAGAKYAMRYYLQKEIVPGITEGGSWINDMYQFRSNISAVFGNWVQSHPTIRFWIVTNKTVGDIPPDSAYSESYLWLKAHFQCYDVELGIQPYHAVHVFANLTNLSSNHRMHKDFSFPVMHFQFWNMGSRMSEGILPYVLSRK